MRQDVISTFKRNLNKFYFLGQNQEEIFYVNLERLIEF